MSTTTRRAKREKHRAKEKAKELAAVAEFSKMMEPDGGEFWARADCGCCDVGPMYFLSKRSAVDAFKKAGLTNGGRVTDDRGTPFGGIDTFYGFWRAEEDRHEMGFLFERLFEELDDDGI